MAPGQHWRRLATHVVKQLRRQRAIVGDDRLERAARSSRRLQGVARLGCHRAPAERTRERIADARQAKRAGL